MERDIKISNLIGYLLGAVHHSNGREVTTRKTHKYSNN